MEKQRNFVEAQPVGTSGAEIPPPARSACGTAAPGGPEECLSLRGILTMILRHWREIAAFVLLATLAVSIPSIISPRQYAAEGYLQVLPPLSRGGRVDQALFETMLATHLQKAASAYIARNVADQLNDPGEKITPLKPARKIGITRPPKTDLIRLVARGKSEDKALLIVRLWIQEYLKSIQKNNIHIALSQTSLRLKRAQSDLLEKQAMLDTMRAQVTQASPLITLSRAVDDRQIWSDLAQRVVPDPEALKKLSEIHIKGQEQSAEYINLKMAMLGTEQALAVVLARRNLYQEAMLILETKGALNATSQADKPAPTNAAPSEAELYVNMLIQNNEIVQFGEPGLISSARGTLRQTGLFFIVSLGLACFVAFMREWCKGLL